MNTNLLKRPLATLLITGLLAMPMAAAAMQAFKTPEAAMEAFGAAVVDNDESAKQAVLGKNYATMIPPVGADSRYRFLEYWAQSHRVEMDGEARARIAVGNSGWTLPIPLVKTRAGWLFDLQAGKKEITLREIGRNELAVIKVASAFVDAQREYSARDWNGDGVREYARKIVSAAGRKDGLYWPDAADQEPSPLGPLLARAAAEGRIKQPGSYHGYRYRILTAQGPQASGGARDYISDGRMTAGFGLIMWPARFGETGIMTFIVNQEGQIFEQNLGPDTATKVARIHRFDPDTAWRKVDNP